MARRKAASYVRDGDSDLGLSFILNGCHLEEDDRTSVNSSEWESTNQSLNQSVNQSITALAITVEASSKSLMTHFVAVCISSRKNSTTVGVRGYRVTTPHKLRAFGCLLNRVVTSLFLTRKRNRRQMAYNFAVVLPMRKSKSCNKGTQPQII